MVPDICSLSRMLRLVLAGLIWATTVHADCHPLFVLTGPSDDGCECTCTCLEPTQPICTTTTPTPGVVPLCDDFSNTESDFYIKCGGKLSHFLDILLADCLAAVEAGGDALTDLQDNINDICVLKGADDIEWINEYSTEAASTSTSTSTTSSPPTTTRRYLPPTTRTTTSTTTTTPATTATQQSTCCDAIEEKSGPAVNEFMMQWLLDTCHLYVEFKVEMAIWTFFKNTVDSMIGPVVFYPGCPDDDDLTTTPPFHGGIMTTSTMQPGTFAFTTIVPTTPTTAVSLGPDIQVPCTCSCRCPDNTCAY